MSAFQPKRVRFIRRRRRVDSTSAFISVRESIITECQPRRRGPRAVANRRTSARPINDLTLNVTSACKHCRWWHRPEMSRLLVDPAVQGSESGNGLPQRRGGLLAPLVVRRTPGYSLRGPCLEVSTLGTVHVGRSRGGRPLRRRVGRRNLPEQRRPSDVVQKNPRDPDGVLPHGISAVGHGTGHVCSPNRYLLLLPDDDRLDLLPSCGRNRSTLSFPLMLPGVVAIFNVDPEILLLLAPYGIAVRFCANLSHGKRGNKCASGGRHFFDQREKSQVGKERVNGQ